MHTAKETREQIKNESRIDITMRNQDTGEEVQRPLSKEAALKMDLIHETAKILGNEFMVMCLLNHSAFYLQMHKGADPQDADRVIDHTASFMLHLIKNDVGVEEILRRLNRD